MNGTARSRGVALFAVIVALTLLASACGGGTEDTAAPAEDTAAPAEDTAAPAEDTAAPAEDTAAPAEDTAASAEDTPAPEGAQADAALGDACGDRIVIQTDWFPQPEHAASYQLAGTDGEFDAERGIYTGEVGDSGVAVEVRAGGPFIGFQQATALLYQDPDIDFAYIVTDEAVRNSGRLPVVGVVAPLEISPQMLMWDPEVYDFAEFADIGETDATVLYFEGAIYMDYLVGQGFIKPEQIDGSYDGSPARFIAEGDLVQQGFATNEPYMYENVFEEWGKPVDYQLIHDSGFEAYPQVFTVRQEDVEAQADCLAAIVPLIQQAQVDYMADPGPVNQLMVDVVGQLEGWTMTPELTDFAVQTMEELEIVSNGPDDTLGNFDMERVQGVVDLLAPIYAEQGVDSWDPETTAEDIATNDFIDPAISLPQ